MFPLSNFGFSRWCITLPAICVLCPFLLSCWLLEVVVTKKRLPRFDNREQISLGNRCDLTQDAELPLGFFYTPLAFPHSRPLSVYGIFFEEGDSCGGKMVFSFCRE